MKEKHASSYRMQPTAHNLLCQIRTSVEKASKSEGVISIPTILVPKSWLRIDTCIAEAVLNWLLFLGFDGDRTRMSLGGYPGLFRELWCPPPWVNIEPEDCEGPRTEERERELEPLYIQACTRDNLEATFKVYLRENRRKLKEWLLVNPGMELYQNLMKEEPDIDKFKVEPFSRVLHLARLIGVDTFEDLAKAVFMGDEFGDEFPPFVGAPDLFIWTKPPHTLFWFFAEVKGPRDSLRTSQYEWINSNWHEIKGRFVILSVVSA